MQSLAKNDIEHYTVNCIEKTKIKKEAGNGPFKTSLIHLFTKVRS